MQNQEEEENARKGKEDLWVRSRIIKGAWGFKRPGKEKAGSVGLGCKTRLVHPLQASVGCGAQSGHLDQFGIFKSCLKWNIFNVVHLDARLPNTLPLLTWSWKGLVRLGPEVSFYRWVN